jgi:uncharacterized protein YciI
MLRLAIALILLALVSAAADQASHEPQYVMDHYVLGLLKRGPRWTPEVTEQTKKIQEGHLANIRRMGAAGILIVAGPFEDDTDLRGTFIFKCSLAEAQTEASKDPAIQAGRLVLELHPWFAAKGLKVDPPK